SDLDFLRAQVLTSRNIRANWLTDYWYGSLNYQVEHHLFPSMARSKVRRAHNIVRDYCAEIGVPYHETSLIGSFRELLGFLHEVGAPLRAVSAGAASEVLATPPGTLAVARAIPNPLSPARRLQMRRHR